MFIDGEPEEDVEEDTTEEATLCVCGENCVYGEGCECECESEAACTCLECKETTSYTYDAYGNITSTETTNLVETIKTQQSYTANGNYLASSTNSAGKTETYNYNTSNGTLTGVTDAENNTVNYTYTAMNELAAATQAVNSLTNGNSLSYSAEYSQDRLTGITTGNGVNYTYEYDSKGRQDKVKVENSTIVSYGYGTGDNSDRVESITYVNGLTITYAYDESGNIIGISYDGGATYAYEYQYGDGALTLVKDNINGQTTYYSDDGYSIYVTPVDESAEETLLYTCTYDEDGNFIETTGDATYAHVSEEEQYNKSTGETTNVYTIQNRTGSGTTESPYVYGSAFDITVTDVSDYFGRAKERIVKNVSGETTKFQMTTSYGYYSPDSGETSELLTSYNNTISADDYAAKNINFTYSYDDNGNITEIRQNGTLTNKYYYDEAGQVIREDYVQQEKTITYSYDNGGNIVSKNEYAYTDSEVLGDVVTTNTFSYSNSSWKDQLTSFNGEDITYDALGNPVSYGDYITYTWNGRQLLEYKNSDPDDYIRCVYTYDADGLRTRKLVYRQKSSTDTTEYIAQQYDYVWKDGILDSEKYVIYNNDGSVYQSIVYKYFYDEYSSPIGIALWIDGEKNGNYWYIKNAQGDVTAVYCEGTGIVVNYHYDAYGNMNAVAGEEGALGAIVMLLYNSITYRGYYFDVHTNMYYLQSRYYSPVWGRFLNADDVEYLGVSGTALSYNLYAYCENDAVNEVDPSGYSLVGAILGIASVLATLLFIPSSSRQKEAYSSADEAAKAFAKEIYSASYYIRHEYSAEIYSRNRNGKTKYYLTDTKLGAPHSSPLTIYPATLSVKFVASVHTHPNSLDFSSKDKDNADKYKLNSYVICPDLILQKYNYKEKETTIVGKIQPMPLSDKKKKSLVNETRESWKSHFKNGICSSGFNECKIELWPRECYF